MSFHNPPPPKAGAEVRYGEGEEYELGAVSERLYDPEADAKIVGWRELSFLLLGFPTLLASTLAVRRDVDREEVERLVKGGAPFDTVALIVL